MSEASFLVEESKEYVKYLNTSVEHLLLTGECVQQIYSNADDAMIIACLLHDIERAFKENRLPPIREYDSWNDTAYCLWHGKRSAEFAVEFLRKKGASEGIITEVYSLIEYHELGGTKEQNIIKDADSLSFLQTQVDGFIRKMDQRGGKENIRRKFTWMYERITSADVKELAMPYYTVSLEKLESKEVTR